MRISRKDMQKLRNVSQDETLELTLKDIGIEVEPEPLLPGVTRGKLEVVVTSDSLVRLLTKDGRLLLYERAFDPQRRALHMLKEEAIANANLHAAAPDMAVMLEKIRDLTASGGVLGWDDSNAIAALLREAGADI